jgi:hypothetical protein
MLAAEPNHIQFTQLGERNATVALPTSDLIDAIQEAFLHADDGELAFLDGHKNAEARQEVLGPPVDYGPFDLPAVGWGVIWPPEPLTLLEQAHKSLLEPLLERRARQTTATRCHEFQYRSGWTSDDFLYAEGREVLTGAMRPEVVPYYLCIVGSPARIPWQFQQQLDAEYAVGRLWFDDPADCERYVALILAYEGAPPPAKRFALFTGTQHVNDRFSELSSRLLLRPLHQLIADDQRLAPRPELLFAPMRATLLKRLCGPTPSLLFLAQHGYEFSRPDPRQPALQGALVCQDWPGQPAELRRSDLLAADELADLAPGAFLGSVGVACCCFGAGTPREPDWLEQRVLSRLRRKLGLPEQSPIADEPFVARLPQKLLAAGMLAFVGSATRVWEFSFASDQGKTEQLTPLRSVVRASLQGVPIGHALDTLNTRWVQLTRRIDQEHQRGGTELIEIWRSRNDCRGYVLLGDPAAALRNA